MHFRTNTKTSIRKGFAVFAIIILYSSATNAQSPKQHHFYRIYRMSESMYPLEYSGTHQEYAKKMDSVLNFIYNGIMRDYRKDKIFIRSLQQAQRAWIKFRDASLDAITSSHLSMDGMEGDECRWEYFSTITRRRIEELNLWYQGKPKNNDGGFGYIPDTNCSSYRTESQQDVLHGRSKRKSD